MLHPGPGWSADPAPPRRGVDWGGAFSNFEIRTAPPRSGVEKNYAPPRGGVDWGGLSITLQNPIRDP